MKILIDPTKCKGSGECIKVCPEKAITKVNGIAILDESKCDFDGLCIPACPHEAISFSGNDHVIERNQIHHVVLETDDAGAIYTCPRDFTSRGTRIRHNHLHHCGTHHAPVVPKAQRTEPGVVYEPLRSHGTSLIYLDDLAGGMLVEGNILEDAYRALLIGGGRDNVIRGNLILGGNIGIWIDGRGLGWATKHAKKGGVWGLYRKFEVRGGDLRIRIKAIQVTIPKVVCQNIDNIWRSFMLTLSLLQVASCNKHHQK